MIRCLKNFLESKLQGNQVREFTPVTSSTGPGISVSQNRNKIKTGMSWIKNRNESVNNANITMTNEVTKLHDRKSVSIIEKGTSHHQIVPASTTKLSYAGDQKMFRKPVVNSGHSTFPHLNSAYSVSSKRKLKEKTHFTEINRPRVTDVNQSSSFAPWSSFLLTRREMVPLHHGVQWPGGRPLSRPPLLHRLAVSPTFGRHHHLVSGPTLSRHTGPLLHRPYFVVQNRNGPVIQHFPFYG